MLRGSTQAIESGLDIAVVVTGDDPPLPNGPALVRLVDELTTRTDRSPTAEREALVAVAGRDATERAIGVCATFQMMNRLLDGVGAPVRASLHPIAERLGFDPADLPR